MTKSFKRSRLKRLLVAFMLITTLVVGMYAETVRAAVVDLPGGWTYNTTNSIMTFTDGIYTLTFVYGSNDLNASSTHTAPPSNLYQVYFPGIGEAGMIGGAAPALTPLTVGVVLRVDCGQRGQGVISVTIPARPTPADLRITRTPAPWGAGVGDATADPLVVTVHNDGDSPSGALAWRIVGPDAANFAPQNGTLASIAGGGNIASAFSISANHLPVAPAANFDFTIIVYNPATVGADGVTPLPSITPITTSYNVRFSVAPPDRAPLQNLVNQANALIAQVPPQFFDAVLPYIDAAIAEIANAGASNATLTVAAIDLVEALINALAGYADYYLLDPEIQADYYDDPRFIALEEARDGALAALGGALGDMIDAFLDLRDALNTWLAVTDDDDWGWWLGQHTPAQPHQPTTPPPDEEEPEVPEVTTAPPADVIYVSPASEVFPDIADGAWYHEAISHVVGFGLFHGDPEGNFDPQGIITRAQFAAVIARMVGADVSAYGAAGSFTDTAGHAWAFDYIEWAAAHGVVTGFDDGTFRPDAHITREAMAVMLARAIEGFDIDVPSGDALSFADQAEISPWAVAGVGMLTQAGIIQGRPDGTFDPTATATRAEAATVFSRLLGHNYVFVIQ